MRPIQKIATRTDLVDGQDPGWDVSIRGSPYKDTLELKARLYRTAHIEIHGIVKAVTAAGSYL